MWRNHVGPIRLATFQLRENGLVEAVLDLAMSRYGLGDTRLKIAMAVIPGTVPNQ